MTISNKSSYVEKDMNTYFPEDREITNKHMNDLHY